MWPQHCWHLWAGGQPFSLTVVWIIGKSLTRCYFTATATILPWAAAWAVDASFPFNGMRAMRLWIISAAFTPACLLCPISHSSDWWQGSHLISTCELLQIGNLSLANLLCCRGLLIFKFLFVCLFVCFGCSFVLTTLQTDKVPSFPEAFINSTFSVCPRFSATFIGTRTFGHVCVRGCL